MKTPLTLLVGLGLTIAPITGRFMAHIAEPPKLPFDATMMITLLGIILTAVGGYQAMNRALARQPVAAQRVGNRKTRR